MKRPTGDEIVALLGISESDDRMLDMFEALGVNKDEFERDEDVGSFWVDLEDEIGLMLTFNSSLPEQYRIPNHEGGQYLVGIMFDYNFKPLPYQLLEDNNLDIVEEKLNEKPNFISIDDSSRLQWVYENLNWLTIEFEDDTYSSIYSVGLSIFEDPIENWDGNNGFNTIIKPFKR